VLVTCDTTNLGSRKVIEAKGVFEDQRGVKLRYWLPTSRRTARGENMGEPVGGARRRSPALSDQRVTQETSNPTPDES
jgi:hypothetical protein